MAVCWRCPSCGAVSCEDDATVVNGELVCDRCADAVAARDTLCPVCDTPNPWWRRDTLHYLCRTCGNSQTLYSRIGAAS